MEAAREVTGDVLGVCVGKIRAEVSKGSSIQTYVCALKT